MQIRIPKPDKLPYQIYLCNLSLSASASFHDGMEANHIRSVGTLLGCYEIICPRSWGARNPHLITIYICRCWSTGDLASRNSNASPYTTFVFSYFPSLSTLARFPLSLACAPCIGSRINERARTRHLFSCCFLHVARFSLSTGFLWKCFFMILPYKCPG